MSKISSAISFDTGSGTEYRSFGSRLITAIEPRGIGSLPPLCLRVLFRLFFDFERTLLLTRLLIYFIDKFSFEFMS